MANTQAPASLGASAEKGFRTQATQQHPPRRLPPRWHSVTLCAEKAGRNPHNRSKCCRPQLRRQATRGVSKYEQCVLLRQSGGRGPRWQRRQQRGLPPRLLEAVGSLVRAPWLPHRQVVLVRHDVVQHTHSTPAGPARGQTTRPPHFSAQLVLAALARLHHQPSTGTTKGRKCTERPAGACPENRKGRKM